MDEAKPNETTQTPQATPVPQPAASASPDAAAQNVTAAMNEPGKNLDFILDIPLRVSVELGRAKILVQDLLKLHKGSVMELNKLAGEPLEVLVNNRVVARGEVIVINEKFGIRLTDIVNHAERIRELGAAA